MSTISTRKADRTSDLLRNELDKLNGEVSEALIAHYLVDEPDDGESKYACDAANEALTSLRAIYAAYVTEGLDVLSILRETMFNSTRNTAQIRLRLVYRNISAL